MTSKIETRRINGWDVELHYDQDPDSPRNWTTGADLVLKHKRWDLPNDAEIDFDAFSSWEEVRDHLLDGTALAVLPVYALDHSGIALSVRDFADPWDSGQLGVAYVTPKNWADTQGDVEWTGSDEQLAMAHALIRSEVEVYGQYLNGDVYGYVIRDPLDGEEQESLWGMYGFSYAEEEATQAAEALEHEPKCTGTLNRRTGTIDHEGDCPLHPRTVAEQMQAAFTAEANDPAGTLRRAREETA